MSERDRQNGEGICTLFHGTDDDDGGGGAGSDGGGDGNDDGGGNNNDEDDDEDCPILIFLVFWRSNVLVFLCTPYGFLMTNDIHINSLSLWCRLIEFDRLVARRFYSLSVLYFPAQVASHGEWTFADSSQRVPWQHDWRPHTLGRFGYERCCDWESSGVGAWALLCELFLLLGVCTVLCKNC